MRALPALAVALAPMSAAAQEVPAEAAFALSPAEAKQCALWASYASSQVEDDPRSQISLQMAVNFFSGVYEGASGQGISAVPDVAMLGEVGADFERFTGLCAGHLETFATRMAAWGEILVRIADAEAVAAANRPED